MDKLIGYRRFTGKNGKSYCVANVTSDFSPRDVENGSSRSCSERGVSPG